jgi:hypothetical protein
MPFSELAARYEALPPLHPPRRWNLHAAMEEARRRDEARRHNMSRQNISGYQAQSNNNNDDDDDFYVDEPVRDHHPPVSFLKLYF